MVSSRNIIFLTVLLSAALARSEEKTFADVMALFEKKFSKRVWVSVSSYPTETANGFDEINDEKQFWKRLSFKFFINNPIWVEGGEDCILTEGTGWADITKLVGDELQAVPLRTTTVMPPLIRASACKEFPDFEGKKVSRTYYHALDFVLNRNEPLSKARFEEIKSINHGWYSSEGLYGLLDKNYTWIVTPRFSKVTPFREGFSTVKQRDRFGVIKQDGSWLVQPEFVHLSAVREGLAIAFDGTRWLLLNIDGSRKYLDLQINKHDYFSCGLCAVLIGDKWGYLDKSGALVIPCKYDSATNYSDNFAGVQIGKTWGVIDQKGNIHVPFEYEGVWSISRTKAQMLLGQKVKTINFDQ